MNTIHIKNHFTKITGTVVFLVFCFVNFLSSEGQSVDAQTCATPAVPTNIQATCNTVGNQLTVSWNAVSGADRYHLRLNNLNNSNGSTMDCNVSGDFCVNDFMSGTSYTFTTFTGNLYSFWIHSGNSCGGWSDGIGPINVQNPFPCGPTPTAPPVATMPPTTIPQMCHQDVAITLPTPPPLGDLTIKLRLKFQGILLANIKDESWKTQKIKVSVIRQIADPQSNLGAQTIFSKSFENVEIKTTGEVDAKGIAIWEGTVTANGVVAGEKYSILVKGPKHLQRKICVNNPNDREEEGYPYRCLGAGSITLLSGETALDFSNVLLQAGDLPGGTEAKQDGIVNAFDVSLVINMIRNGQSVLPADITIADIDLNGIVNAKDRSYLIETLEEKYGDEE